MSLFFHRLRYGCVPWLFLLALLTSVNAHPQDRADCHVYQSAILHSAVRYCVYLPASYSAPEGKAKKYPVLYLLHGLGGTQETMALDGEWNVLRDLRQNQMVGDFLVVSPEAWDTFYINSRDGKTLYGDFFLNEFIPFIERNYRIRQGRAERGITGFSMGGYGAMRFAFSNPEMFGSVSSHSGVLIKAPPRPLSPDAPTGNLALEVFSKVFGNPIKRGFWDLNSPFVLARDHAAELKSMKIYFDCGTEDEFGLYRGAGEMDKTLKSLRIPHEFHLYPGGHNDAYLREHRIASFEFHWKEFKSVK